MDLRKKQTMTGEVLSDKMEKTVVVQITRKIPHPVYGKYVKRSKKVLAHVKSVQPKIGDIVKNKFYAPNEQKKKMVCW